MAKTRILVVDDEGHIAELIRYNLAEEGYEVHCVESGEEALAYTEGAPEGLPHLVILDLMLPGIDGVEVCRKWKANPITRHIPILMLTAKGQEGDVLTGIGAGADEYMTKPFSPNILIARVGMILRRGMPFIGASQDVLKFRALTVIPAERRVLVKGKPVTVTPTEFQLLEFLCRHPGSVFTRQQLVQALGKMDASVTDRSIDVRFFGLRKNLGPVAGQYIETVRGVGYRLKD